MAWPSRAPVRFHVGHYRNGTKWGKERNRERAVFCLNSETTVDWCWFAVHTKFKQSKCFNTVVHVATHLALTLQAREEKQSKKVNSEQLPVTPVLQTVRFLLHKHLNNTQNASVLISATSNVTGFDTEISSITVNGTRK